MNQQKRLAIFFFYDAEGIADRYVDVYLQGLKEVCERIVIVANGFITPQTRKLFSKHSNDIIVRKNVGYDSWAHKAGLEYVGWDKLRTYDEVVLTNFTLMGPVYPFSEMFDKMAEQEDLDFWGATVYHRLPDDPFHCNPYKYVPEHIQSSFIVYRNKFLKSRELEEYWDHLPKIHNYDEAVGLHESYFTKYFQDQGFQWAVYADSDEEKDLTDYYLMYQSYRAIKDKRCPVFKRRSFFHSQDSFLDSTMGEQSKALFEYLKNKTQYDTDLIWENILRTCNQYDIARTLGLHYTLPSNSRIDQPAKTDPAAVALVMHLYYMDLLDDSVYYAAAMPEQSDIYVTTSNKENIDKIRTAFSVLPNKVEIRLIENRGRDVSSLLVGAADIQEKYKYICFYHDKKVKQSKPYSIGRSFAYKMSEGTLCSKDYVNNIISTFDANPRLGLLTPPAPNHSVYYYVIGSDWGPNYSNTKALIEKLNLHVPISKDKPPVAPLGTTFWYRTAAMKKLFAKQWTFQDFPPEPNKDDGTLLHAIERIYPFVRQDAGYYPAYVMPDTLNAIELTNLEFYLRNLNSVLFKAGFDGTNYKTKVLLEERLKSEATLRNSMKIATQKLSKMECAANETFYSGIVYGCRQTVYMNDADLLRAARLAEIQDEKKIYTIGFAPSWTVFRISVKIWLGKHSLFPSHRRQAKFLASQNLPSVSQTWWLVRKSFGNWLSKHGSKSA